MLEHSTRVMAPDYNSVLVKRQAPAPRTSRSQRVGLGTTVPLEQSEPEQSNSAPMSRPAGLMVQRVAEQDGGQAVVAIRDVMGNWHTAGAVQPWASEETSGQTCMALGVRC